MIMARSGALDLEAAPRQLTPARSERPRRPAPAAQHGGWDALAQARGVPLVTLLAERPAIPAHNSTGL
jgi:hypothetical protein